MAGDLLHIPPINTIVSLAGQGELFHARSKSVFAASDNRLCGIWFLNGAHQFYVPSFLLAQKNQSDFEDQFSRYVADNIMILKNETGIALDEFLNNQLKPVEQTLYCAVGIPSEPNELEYIPSLNAIKKIGWA